MGSSSRSICLWIKPRESDTCIEMAGWGKWPDSNFVVGIRGNRFFYRETHYVRNTRALTTQEVAAIYQTPPTSAVNDRRSQGTMSVSSANNRIGYSLLGRMVALSSGSAARASEASPSRRSNSVPNLMSGRKANTVRLLRSLGAQQNPLAFGGIGAHILYPVAIEFRVKRVLPQRHTFVEIRLHQHQ